jgi:hypothetical protein
VKAVTGLRIGDGFLREVAVVILAGIGDPVWMAEFEARQRERRRVVASIADQHALTQHEASALLFSFEGVDSSEGQDLQ